MNLGILSAHAGACQSCFAWPEKIVFKALDAGSGMRCRLEWSRSANGFESLCDMELLPL